MAVVVDEQIESMDGFHSVGNTGSDEDGCLFAVDSRNTRFILDLRTENLEVRLGGVGKGIDCLF
jgi:NADPH-dependent curcumin reductase CurA